MRSIPSQVCQNARLPRKPRVRLPCRATYPLVRYANLPLRLPAAMQSPRREEGRKGGRKEGRKEGREGGKRFSSILCNRASNPRLRKLATTPQPHTQSITSRGAGPIKNTPHSSQASPLKSSTITNIN